MNTRFKLAPGEVIRDCSVPAGEVWQYPACAECGQLAYREVCIALDPLSSRRVPLCFSHFLRACLQIEELRKYARDGKIG
jgi:hypothetical protein